MSDSPTEADSPFRKFFSWIERHAEECLILPMLAYMVLSLNVEVVRRYVFGQSSPYTEEIARFLLIWIVFLGIPYGIRWKRHVVIDFLLIRRASRLDLLLQVLSHLVFAVFLVFLGSITVEILAYMYTREVVTDAMQIPKWIVMAVIPIGCFLGLLRLLQSMIGEWKRYRREG